MATDDHRLALRVARDGDEAAFALLVERHRPTLVAYVTRRLGPGIAEDAVQEALVSAHRALRAGVVPDEVRAWLHTIALRRGLDIARRQPDATADLDRVELPAGGPSPEETAIMASELGGIVDAWAALPDRQRSALAMSVLEGRSLDEIGDRLRVGPVAAKSLVARARRRLALQLPAVAPIGLLVRFEARFARAREIVAAQLVDTPVAAGVKICAVACAATVAMPSAAVVDPGSPPPVRPLVAQLATPKAKPKPKPKKRTTPEQRTAARPQPAVQRQAVVRSTPVVTASAPAASAGTGMTISRVPERRPSAAQPVGPAPKPVDRAVQGGASTGTGATLLVARAAG